MGKFFCLLYDLFRRRPLLLYGSLVCLSLLCLWGSSRMGSGRWLMPLAQRNPASPLMDWAKVQLAPGRGRVMLILSQPGGHGDSSRLAGFAEAIRRQMEPGSGRTISPGPGDSLSPEMTRLILHHLPEFLDTGYYLSLRQILLARLPLLHSMQADASLGRMEPDPLGIIHELRLQGAIASIHRPAGREKFFMRDGGNLFAFVLDTPLTNGSVGSAGKKNILQALRLAQAAGYGDLLASIYDASNPESYGFKGIKAIWLTPVAILLVLLVGLSIGAAIWFRSLRPMLVIWFPLAFGLFFTLALLSVSSRALPWRSLDLAALFTALPAAFSLELFARYRRVGSARQALNGLGLPIALGTLIPGLALLLLRWQDFYELQSLGLFTGLFLVGSGLFALVFLPQLLGPDFRGRSPAFDPSKRKPFDGLVLAALMLLGWGLLHLLMIPDRPADAVLPANLPVAGTLDAEQSNSLFLVIPGKNVAEAEWGQEGLSAGLYPMEKSQKILGWMDFPVRIEADSLRKRRLQAWKDFWSPGQPMAILRQLSPEPPSQQTGDWLELRNLIATDYSAHSLQGSFPQVPAGDLSLLTQVWLRPGSGFPLLQRLKQGLPLAGNLPGPEPRPLPGGAADWSKMAWLAGLCSLAILMLAWGRIELALLAWIPLWIGYGWLQWVTRCSAASPAPFGPLVPAVLYGSGAAYSLWILQDFLMRYRADAPEKGPSGKLLAFLLLVFAFVFSWLSLDEPLGMLLAISISSVVLLVRLILPRLYSWLIPSRIRKNLYPWTASGLLISIFAFTYFCLGSFLLGLLGFLLVRLNPLNREKGKLLFHTLISKFTWSQLYIMTNVKKRIINPQGENFSRPVIMICNHQSFLDILATTLLSPKLILLTNDWVWNSPVFGAVVRIADYYPVMAEGIEKSVARLADRVKQGYSIVVFPEGTRSPDGDIHRFHKGAFYLAEKLQLDILPVMIHGTSHTMTKGDFLLKDGYVTTKYLPRIAARDPRFGEGYATRAKQIAKYFRQEFRQLRREMEQPAWYREKLIYNYIYKGPVLEWYMRVKLQIENNYQAVHDLLPLHGDFLDIGCGYGMMTYLLQFAGPQRRITGIDYDEEKIALAKGCFSRDERIRFFHSGALQFPMDQYDGILLMDILHYLDRDEQEALLRSCFKSLKPGGRILIREGDADLPGRHRGTRLTEFFSTQVFRFNRTGSGRLSYVSGTALREIAAAAGLGFRVTEESRYNSNRLFVLE